MATTCLLLLLTVLGLEARQFNNPVLDNDDYPDPGGIKFGDRYYVVTTTNNNNAEKYPISTSTDLQNWELAGYIFNASNLPPWSDKDHEFWAPEIHQVGDEFRAYFAARKTKPEFGRLCIGVATAPNPAGPWKSADQPLFYDTTGDHIDVTLMNDNGTLYLVWKGHEEYIEAKKLNPDGLSFANETEPSTKLFKNTLPWESVLVEGPWYIRRGKYHYMMYSSDQTCNDNYSIGVARSLNALGPYEKQGTPLLVMTDKFRGPGHNSVVKDVDNVSDVMLYHVHKKDVDCVVSRPTMATSMGWGADDWPYAYDNPS